MCSYRHDLYDGAECMVQVVQTRVEGGCQAEIYLFVSITGTHDIFCEFLRFGKKSQN